MRPQSLVRRKDREQNRQHRARRSGQYSVFSNLGACTTAPGTISRERDVREQIRNDTKHDGVGSIQQWWESNQEKTMGKNEDEEEEKRREEAKKWTELRRRKSYRSGVSRSSRVASGALSREKLEQRERNEEANGKEKRLESRVRLFDPDSGGLEGLVCGLYSVV